MWTETLEKPSIGEEKLVIALIASGKDWLTPIRHHLLTEKPFDNDVLYQRSISIPLIKCLSLKKAYMF